MLLNRFIYSMVCTMLLLQSSTLCMQHHENSETEIEMQDITPQRATISSLIQQILQDSPHQCEKCKKEIASFDVSYYLVNAHNSVNFADKNCLVCFKKETERYNSQNTSLFFDLYNLHDSCYIKLCKKTEESTCSKCTQKSLKPKKVKTIKNNNLHEKKACTCCAEMGASFACSQAFHELSLSCCGCFFGIIESFSSSND
ncbi:hypothetical protein JST56_06015 [Candidatus Dependentiae bacterium]|nr:hypothetical protein [Candidatus Dependentiae bacterium]